jgi:hypothetical protein
MDNTTPPPPSSTSQIADEVKAEAKGLIGGLTDCGFKSFITPKIPCLIYGVLLLMVVWHGVQFLIFAARFGSVMGFISGLVFLVVGVVLSRVFVEVLQAMFKILETLQKIESKQK